MIATEKDFKLVIDKYPDLTINGFRHNSYYELKLTREQKDQKFIEDRNLLKKEYRQFLLCCEWLKGCKKRKTINTSLGSYNLKHRVEAWAERNKIKDNYISNGVFIAAAIHSGFDCCPIFDSPNANFNISMRSPAIQED